jgi:hypothetical protein
MNETPYSREEVRAAGNAFPERGLVCQKCKTIIPQFRDLSEKDKTRILTLIRDNRKIMAIWELRAATGCSIIWGKIWVEHSGKPEPLENEILPCPYCGKPLRTSLAKQCRYCLKDWH